MREPNQKNEEARRRRLDEIFAGEPHLSPTMKAQRLHEMRQAGPPEGLTRPTSLPMQDKAIGLAQAAEILRAGTNENVPMDAATTRLFRFRETVLRRWLADAPQRRDSGEGK